jgi:hypothetical protein
VVVVDDVRADRLGEKTSKGVGVTTEDRPGHVKLCAQVIHKRLCRRKSRFVWRRRLSESCLSSAQESSWSPLKDS